MNDTNKNFTKDSNKSGAPDPRVIKQNIDRNREKTKEEKNNR